MDEEKRAARSALTLMVALIVLIGTAATWASHTAPSEWAGAWYGVSLAFTSFGGILAFIIFLIDWD